jgi:hypothetical protein
MRRLLGSLLFGLALGAGAMLAWRLLPPARPAPPEPPALVERVREVARLETLEVALYRKVTFEPGPVPAGSFWGDVVGWARHALRPPRGRAIVFADAHLALDLSRLGPASLRTSGRRAWVVLPPLRARVEIKPGEIEIIGSNLDSAQTAQLLELARGAFQREVEADHALRDRALGSARRALTALLLGLGFDQVDFVDALPAPHAG